MTEKTPVELRREEVAAYQQNIAMYQAIMETLPSEWPEHLKHLKGVSDRHAAIADIESLDDVALVSDLWTYEQAKASLRSEMVEMRKAQAILTFLEAQENLSNP